MSLVGWGVQTRGSGTSSDAPLTFETFPTGSESGSLPASRRKQVVFTITPWTNVHAHDEQDVFTSRHSSGPQGECVPLPDGMQLVVGNGAKGSGYVSDELLEPGGFVTLASREKELVGLVVFRRKGNQEMHISAIASAPGSGAGTALLSRVEAQARGEGLKETTLESLDYALAKTKANCSGGKEFDLPLYYARRGYVQTSHCGNLPLNELSDDPVVVNMSKCMDPGDAAAVVARARADARSAWKRMRARGHALANTKVSTLDEYLLKGTGDAKAAKEAFRKLCAGPLADDKINNGAAPDGLAATLVELARISSLRCFDVYNRAVVERFFELENMS